jgi:hypothetical protein
LPQSDSLTEDRGARHAFSGVRRRMPVPRRHVDVCQGPPPAPLNLDAM